MPYRHLSSKQMIEFYRKKEDDKKMIEEMKEKKKVERELKRKQAEEKKSSEKKTKKVKVSVSKCAKCNKVFKKCEYERLIGCESCPRWYHVACTDLTDLDENDDLKEIAFECVICTA